jgi:hypothetical protein
MRVLCKQVEVRRAGGRLVVEISLCVCDPPDLDRHDVAAGRLLMLPLDMLRRWGQHDCSADQMRERSRSLTGR